MRVCGCAGVRVCGYVRACVMVRVCICVCVVAVVVLGGQIGLNRCLRLFKLNRSDLPRRVAGVAAASCRQCYLRAK